MTDQIQDALDAYLGTPTNFGPDDRATRLAEEDAFRAGYDAALRQMMGVLR